MIGVMKLLMVVVPIVIAIAVGLKFSRDDRGEIKISPKPALLAISAVFVLVGVFASLSIGQIEAGTRGVVLQFGAVTGQIKGEGLYFITPFVNTIQVMDVTIQKHVSSARAASKDLQDVNTEVTVNFRLNPKAVHTVYQDLRGGAIEIILTPNVEEAIKAVSANFNAEELITKRADVRIEIEAAIKDKIMPFGITVEAVSITDFQFTTVFAQSIEAKVVAVQAALEAQNKLQQIEIEALQAEAKAQGESSAIIKKAFGDKEAAIKVAEGSAQAKVLIATAEAEAILLVAKAQAQANDYVRITLNDDLIKYTLTQQLADDIRVVVLPAGSEFILGPEVVGGIQ